MPIIPVILRSAEAELVTYAMLNSCSTGTFILEDLREELKIDGVDADEIHPLIPDAKIGLLIGMNCPEAIEPKDFVVSTNGGSFAVLTFTGWMIIGPLHMSSKDSTTVSCNRIIAKEICSEEPMDHHFAVDQVVKEIISPEALTRMWEIEFNEEKGSNERSFSQEDKLFLKKVEQGIKKITMKYHFLFEKIMLSCQITEAKRSKEHIGSRRSFSKMIACAISIQSF